MPRRRSHSAKAGLLALRLHILALSHPKLRLSVRKDCDKALYCLACNDAAVKGASRAQALASMTAQRGCKPSGIVMSGTPSVSARFAGSPPVAMQKPLGLPSAAG